MTQSATSTSPLLSASASTSTSTSPPPPPLLLPPPPAALLPLCLSASHVVNLPDAAGLRHHSQLYLPAALSPQTPPDRPCQPCLALSRLALPPLLPPRLPRPLQLLTMSCSRWCATAPLRQWRPSSPLSCRQECCPQSTSRTTRATLRSSWRRGGETSQSSPPSSAMEHPCTRATSRDPTRSSQSAHSGAGSRAELSAAEQSQQRQGADARCCRLSSSPCPAQAAMKGHTDICALFLAAGADVNQTTDVSLQPSSGRAAPPPARCPAACSVPLCRVCSLWTRL